jgi:hypothetical protein
VRWLCVDTCSVEVQFLGNDNELRDRVARVLYTAGGRAAPGGTLAAIPTRLAAIPTHSAGVRPLGAPPPPAQAQDINIWPCASPSSSQARTVRERGNTDDIFGNTCRKRVPCAGGDRNILFNPRLAPFPFIIIIIFIAQSNQFKQKAP